MNIASKHRLILWLMMVVTMLTIVRHGYSYYEETTYSQQEYPASQSNDDEVRVEAWTQLKSDNALLYHTLKFFNPAMLNNIFGNILTFLAAIGLLGAVFAFEGNARVAMVLLMLYCWGRIICLFVLISLVGRGVLPP